MPIVQIQLIEGRNGDQKEKLIKEVTNACVSSLDCPPESVRILLSDIATQDFGVAGQSVKKKREQTS